VDADDHANRYGDPNVDADDYANQDALRSNVLHPDRVADGHAILRGLR
jgi:hypothetical protein